MQFPSRGLVWHILSARVFNPAQYQPTDCFDLANSFLVLARSFFAKIICLMSLISFWFASVVTATWSL